MTNRSKATSTLVGTIITQIAAGSLYAYSFYNLYIAQKVHSPVTTVAIAFGIAMLFLSFGSSLAGKLQEKFGIKKVVIFAAIIFLIGSFIMANATNVWMIYLGVGVLIGFADGSGYLLTLSNCVKWFPHKRGVAAACSIGAYGIGALIFKYVFVDIFPSLGLEHTVYVWGVIVFVLMIIGALLQFDHKPELTAELTSKLKDKTDGAIDYTTKEAFSTTHYKWLCLIFFAAMMSGLYAIGLAKDLGMNLAHMDAQSATSSITVIAIFNLIGRFVFGIISDKVSRLGLVQLAEIFTIIGMVLILFTPLNVVTFYIALALLAVAFGGTITVFPPLISQLFGMKNLTKNYGLLYLGFGISSIIASIIAGATGGYVVTFYVILILSIIGVISSLSVRRPCSLPVRREQKNSL